MEPATVIDRLFEAFSCRPATEADVRNFAALTDAMLRSPVWLLRNRGDLDSAQRTLEAIETHLTKGRTES